MTEQELFELKEEITIRNNCIYVNGVKVEKL